MKKQYYDEILFFLCYIFCMKVTLISVKNFLKKNWLLLLIGIVGIVVISSVSFGFNFNNLRADSGWDSSYDSGGGSSSWDSGGSSWSSGDSWSSSDSWSSGGGSYSGSAGSAIATLVFWVIIIIIIIAISNSKSKSTNSNNTKNLNMYADIDEERIKELLPDETLGSLKHMAFEKFVDIQNAWMNFDYDKLRELCTDELYNSYISQLDTLKLKNGKNIMTAFDNEEIRIINIKKEAKLITVEVYLRVTFYDYVINNKTKEVIRGNKDHTLTNNYQMQFVRKQNDLKEKQKCPNCGAEIKTVTSTKCEYCGSTIVVDANDFVLSKKTNINK